MNKFWDWFNKTLSYASFTISEQPKTFWQYFRRKAFNWAWTLGSLLAIGGFTEGWLNYDRAEIFLWMSLIPIILLIYNTVDEYYAFKWFSTGTRKLSADLLRRITGTSCGLVFLYIVVRVMIG